MNIVLVVLSISYNIRVAFFVREKDGSIEEGRRWFRRFDFFRRRWELTVALERMKFRREVGFWGSSLEFLLVRKVGDEVMF